MTKTQAPTMCEIHAAKDETAVRNCFSIFRELRAHLRSEDEFIERWRSQKAEGFEIVFIKEGEIVVAAAGYRFLHTMAWGHILYIDDLIASPSSRSLGLGMALLQHLQNEARNRDCSAVHLDTGYQRRSPHRAYLRNGFHLDCHHLAWLVNGAGK
jgi:GNAT superfamily N-acetyltransferase